MGARKFRIDNKSLEEMHIISGQEELDKFSFSVERLKDKETYKEVLCIRAFYDMDTEDKNNKTAYSEQNKHYMGKVVGTINKLADEVKKLCEVGIVMSVNDCRDLVNCIKENYYNFGIKWNDGVENDVPEQVIDGVLKYFAEYINENGIEEVNGLYNIPVETFKQEYEESTYDIPIAKIKEGLRLQGYTKCNDKRNDHTVKVKVDGKPVAKKYISFEADKIKEVNEGQPKEEKASE